MKKTFNFIWEIAKTVIIALAIVIPIRFYLFQPFFVKGESMEPTFENGDYLIIDEISYRLRDPQRGEVVVFRYPQNPNQLFIKRIIGLPGETIEVKNDIITISKDEDNIVLNESSYLFRNIVTTGDMKISLNEDEYFVMGDNRPFSYDSRRFGILSKKEIIGKAFLRAWPLDSLTKFDLPNY